jgi:hypothetical protein
VVETFAGEVTNRGGGGAECLADLALEGVELCVAEEADMEGEVLANEKSSNNPDYAGLCKHGGE